MSPLVVVGALVAACAAACLVLALSALRAVRVEEADDILLEASRRRNAPKTPARLAAAGVEMGAGAWAVLVALLALAAAALAWSLFASPPAALVCAVLAVAAAEASVAAAARKRHGIVDEQLGRALPQIAEGMRTGLTFERSLRNVADASAEPLRGELRRVCAELTYDPDPASAVARMAERCGSGDMALLTAALRIHSSRGGSLAETLDVVADTLQKRIEMRRYMRTETANAKTSMKIVAAFPVLILVIQCATQPSYADFYLRSPEGWAVLAAVAAVEALGMAVMMKMADVKFE